MKIQKRIFSFVLALTVMVSSLPISAFAACNHTPNIDGNGNVLNYVTESEHYNICTSCCQQYDKASHSDSDSDSLCDGCGVTLTGGMIHSHTLTASTYGYMDPFGHMVVCGDANCPGHFETHTNCVVGDQDGDGTWDCDYCGWGGPIFGMGGGGSAHTHDFTGSRWYADQTEHYVYCNTCESDIFSSHRDDYVDGKCDECAAPVIFDSTNNMYVHNHTRGNVTQKDMDQHFSTCSTCDRVYNEYHFDYIENGNANNVIADGKCDACDTVLNQNNCTHASGNISGFEIGLDGHKAICADCGQTIIPQANRPEFHTDNDNDDCCDICGATLDANNKHQHDTDNSKWVALDGMEHFAKCMGCSMTFTGSHGDDPNNPDGLCDMCGYGTYTGSCAHQNVWFEVDYSQHKLRCANCQFSGNHENHDDADNNGNCDGCGAAVALDSNNVYAHNHTFNTNWDVASHGHFHECTDNVCTSAIDFGAHVDNVHNNAPTHTTPDDLCDICGYALGQSGGGSSCTHGNGSWMGVERTGHQEHCNECGQPVGPIMPFADNDGDSFCDCCWIPLSMENGVLVHNHTSRPNNWFGGTVEHFYRCDSCGGTGFNAEPHADSDSNSRCDVCNVKLNSNGEHHCDPADLAWLAEDEMQHKRICTDCRRVYEQTQHEDNDNNDKCDKCDATLDNNDIHIHQPDGNWTDMDPAEHACECTECEGWVNQPHGDSDGDNFCDICHRNLTCQHSRYQWYSTCEETHQLHCGDCGDSIDILENHNDADNDGKCDVCRIGVVNNYHTHVWSTQWDPNGSTNHFHNCTDSECTTSSDSIAHADNDGDGACDDCGNTNLGDWCQLHVHNGEYNVIGDKHYTMCGNCGNAFGFAGNHSHSGDFVSFDGNYHYEVCYDCGAEFNKQQHQPVAGCVPMADGHANICGDCREIVISTKSAHKDADKDLFCDDCGVDVDANGIHHHLINGWTCDINEHYKRCDSCGVSEDNSIGSHEDNNTDGRCDVCNASINNDNEHHHTEEYAYANNMAHITSCTDCGNTIGGMGHVDSNGDSTCDKCNTAYVSLDMTLTSAYEAQLKAKLADAIDKAVKQGDYSAIKAMAKVDDNYIRILVDAYKTASDEGIIPEIEVGIYSELVTSEEMEEDSDLKVLKDNAVATVDNSKVTIAFSMEPIAYIYFGSDAIDFTLAGSATYGMEYVLDIESADVDDDRTWYVIATEDFGNTFNKLAQSVKGASSISFAAGNEGSIYVLAYVEDLGPTVHEHNYKSTVTPPTCTTEGYTVYKCDCGDSYVADKTKALGHTFGSYVSNGDGTKTHKCSVCGFEETVKDPTEADTTITEDKASSTVINATKDNVTVAGNKATVDKEAVEAIVEATDKGETVVIPLADATNKNVTEAVVDTEALEAVAEAGNDVVIQLSDGTVKLDAKALEAITERADGENVELRIEKAKKENLKPAQQSSLKNKETAIVVSAQIYSDGEYIGDFRGGTATVMLPFTPPKGQAKEYAVYFISEDGTLEKVVAEYIDGYMIFTINHFSDYAIVRDTVDEVIRVKGKTRYETSIAIANETKAKMGVDKFDNIIIASGTGFADALAGSYLAKVKSAPILMSSGKNDAQLKDYVRANLKAGGTVYILGGTAAVPQNTEDAMKSIGGITVKRLKDKNRYGTNLVILREAGVQNEDIIVATGLNFADSLSASAVGKPILLVNGKGNGLTAEQKSFLASANANNIYIIGGTGAVSEVFENQLKAYGRVERVKGKTRYETSVAIAEKFFVNPDYAVIAYAENFPDGLCGGPLAMTMDAPLILTKTGKQAAAKGYMQAKGIESGAVLGGASLIDDATAKDIFGAIEVIVK